MVLFWAEPSGRIDPMIGGSGVDSAGLGAAATVFKMFYSSGGGAFGGPCARSLRDRVRMRGWGGYVGMSPGIGDGRGFAAKDSDFPIQVLRFINNRAIR